jgi:hypothetical protein
MVPMGRTALTERTGKMGKTAQMDQMVKMGVMVRMEKTEKTGRMALTAKTPRLRPSRQSGCSTLAGMRQEYMTKSFLGCPMARYLPASATTSLDITQGGVF